MRSSLIVLFFALLVFVCGRPSYEEGFLPIPGGSLLHPDCHVVLPEGASLVNLETIVLADGTVQPIPPCKHSSNISTVSREKREAEGTNVVASFFPPGNNNINVFSAYVVVPNYPASGFRNQIIFIYNSLSGPFCDCSLQPTLWYGNAGAGGGAGWYVSVFYITGGVLTSSPVIQVQPGTSLHSYMRLESNGWTAGIEANGNLITSGNFPAANQNMNLAQIHLENRHLVDCYSFPPYSTTSYVNMGISLVNVGYIFLHTSDWSANVLLNECNEGISANANQVYMSYGPQSSQCPSNAGATLGTDQSIYSNGVHILVSDGCAYRLVLQSDGNLVLYNAAYNVMWNSDTANQGSGPYRLAMQNDGNLVLYDATSRDIWHSGSNGNTGSYYLNIQQDGNMVVYGGSGPVWTTNTHY